MKKYAWLALAALAVLGTHLPASADESDAPKFTLQGEIRSRLDYWDNLTDLDSGTSDGFSVWPYRVRIAAHGMLTENIAAHIEMQNFGTFGNEFPDKGFGFEDFSGSGDDVQMYQAFIDLQDIAGSGLGVRVGRQEMPYGTELMLGDGDFYNGVVFDGVRAMRMSPQYDFNAFYFKILEGNNFFGAGSDDSNLFGGTFDWKLEGMGSVGGYLLVAQALDFDSKLNTLGARWNKSASTGSAFDWNLEYAIQSGDFGEPAGGPAQDISADILEGWFGYSFGDTFRNRFHLGVLRASGDSDPFDNDEESFQSLFTDVHENGRLGLLDFFGPSDIENINIGWTGTFGNGHHKLGATYHDFKVAEDLGGDDDLGSEIDITYDFMPNKVLGIQVGYGQLSTGDAVALNADSVKRFWSQIRARW